MDPIYVLIITTDLTNNQSEETSHVVDAGAAWASVRSLMDATDTSKESSWDYINTRTYNMGVEAHLFQFNNPGNFIASVALAHLPSHLTPDQIRSLVGPKTEILLPELAA